MQFARPTTEKVAQSLFRAVIGAAILCCATTASYGQTFHYESKPRADVSGLTLSSADPAPRMMEPAEEIGRPLPRRRYIDPRYQGRAAEMTDLASRRWASRSPRSRVLSRASQGAPIVPRDPADPFIETEPDAGPMLAPPVDGQDWTDEAYPGGPPVEADYGGQYPGDGPWSDEYGPACGGCGQCDECRQHNRLLPCVRDWLHGERSYSGVGDSPYWRNFTTFSGAQGFKAPPDLGMNGNFGFNKGVNWAMPLVDSVGLGLQAGGTLAFSDFDGATGLVDHSRTQVFLTSGLFHRARCNQGWQGGAVLDYLHDDWYVSMDLLQIRAEVSYLMGFHELGMWIGAHTNSDTQAAPASFGVPTVTWQVNNQYNLFYRANFSFGAVGRMWVGFTDFGDVTFGGDATAPLSERWAIQIAQNYLVPRGNSMVPNSVQETWGLTLAMVWYPAAKTPNCRFDPYRPLFPVVDNSWMFLRLK